ncbi:hypothetical protein HGA88_06215 [Candidatus Roizmanbacteria bacterium]|nr:hypothetical protein [Candidatus Roizmanbacteria bacterium]
MSEYVVVSAPNEVTKGTKLTNVNHEEGVNPLEDFMNVASKISNLNAIFLQDQDIVPRNRPTPVVRNMWDSAISGVHSIRLPLLHQTPEQELEQLNQTEALLITCMDPRMAHLEEIFGLDSQTTARISIAGGGVQIDQNRNNALADYIKFVYKYAPNLNKIIITGHTEICAGVRYMSNGEPVETTLYGDHTEVSATASHLLDAFHELDLTEIIDKGEIDVHLLLIHPLENQDIQCDEIVYEYCIFAHTR